MTTTVDALIQQLLDVGPPPPGPWVKDALCAQTDPEAFFPIKGGSNRPAKAVCASCPVQPDCLRYAIETRQKHGIWGGTSERQRRHLTPEQVTP